MTRTAIPLFIASLLVLNACGGSDVPTEADGAGAENIRTLSGLRDSLNRSESVVSGKRGDVGGR
ncbi:MAG TPA: hypothetical protein DDZ43_06425, partial [Hyphomonadaceae bacterium]|nr:hypothetical protein [Hyphomonadaceae bacterium]